MNVIYYESHVTIEPVFDERLAQMKELARANGFRVAELMMKKRKEDTPERSSYDTFCTGHSKDFADLESRMNTLVSAITAAGFAVWRRKIEAVLIDSKYDK